MLFYLLALFFKLNNTAIPNINYNCPNNISQIATFLTKLEVGEDCFGHAFGDNSRAKFVTLYLGQNIQKITNDSQIIYHKK